MMTLAALAALRTEIVESQCTLVSRDYRECFELGVQAALQWLCTESHDTLDTLAKLAEARSARQSD